MNINETLFFSEFVNKFIVKNKQRHFEKKRITKQLNKVWLNTKNYHRDS